MHRSGPRPCERTLCRFHMIDLSLGRDAKISVLPETAGMLGRRRPAHEGMTLREDGDLGRHDARRAFVEIAIIALRQKLQRVPGLEGLEFEDIDEPDIGKRQRDLDRGVGSRRSPRSRST